MRAGGGLVGGHAALQGIHEDGGHGVARLLLDFLKTGGAGDVDFGDVAADDVQPNE